MTRVDDVDTVRMLDIACAAEGLGHLFKQCPAARDSVIACARLGVRAHARSSADCVISGHFRSL